MAQGNERLYASGYYDAWCNGVSGSLRTYANTPSDNNSFTVIYVVIILPNNEFLAVGYYQGGGCGFVYYPTWYANQMVNGQYSCSSITNRFPSIGADYPYQIYDVPGIPQWNGVVDSILVITATFDYSHGYGYGTGEADGDSN